MAQLLAEGTGARWAQVWLMVDDVPELAASWPPDTERRRRRSVPPTRSLRSLDVVLAGERLGMLRLQEHDDQPLSPVEERLFTGLAAQAGLVLRRVRLRAELARRAVELSARADELQVSRRRLVDALDAERRRLERDIHDGAQQHLVALVVNLRLAQKVAVRSPERAGTVLEQQVDAVDSAIATLVDLARGIYPRALADEGVAAAVREVVRTSSVPVTVTDARDREAAPRGRGRVVLLLRRGSAERRQACGRDEDHRRARRRRWRADHARPATTASASTRERSRSWAASATCATGSTRWAAARRPSRCRAAGPTCSPPCRSSSRAEVV